MSATIGEIFQWKIPVSKLLVFNEGKDYVSINDKKGPDLIPKVIHQVWLGSDLPIAQKYFYEKTKAMYPNYEMKLWK